jgi:hypothetical protein
MEIETLRGLGLRDRLLIVDSDEELARAVEVIKRQHSCSASACSDHLWLAQVDQEEARPSRSRR